jgi:hypothetical protein
MSRGRESRTARAVVRSALALGDTWEWDGSQWSLPSMAYHPLLQMVVLYGGWGDKGPETDAWRWDGRAWKRIE